MRKFFIAIILMFTLAVHAQNGYHIQFMVIPTPKDDRGKIKAIQTNKGKYVSTFNVNSGNIEISIHVRDDNKPSVSLMYNDTSVKERKPIDDL